MAWTEESGSLLEKGCRYDNQHSSSKSSNSKLQQYSTCQSQNEAIRHDGSSNSEPNIDGNKQDPKNGSNETTDPTTSSSLPRSRPSKRQPLILNRDAVHFGVRMSVCITVACLFILMRPPGESLHQAVWIVVTVQFVCWFPSLDAASVVEKSLQRLYGTFIGAASALMCGFLSLAILNASGENNVRAQAIFLAICIAVYTFVVTWAPIQYTVGHKKKTTIMNKYNYACILSLLTFYICALPFYSDVEPKWTKGITRVLNVILGCFLGAGLSISILPRPTTKIIHEKMERQIQLAGEAAQAILHMAADSFSDSAYVSRSTTVSRRSLAEEYPIEASIGEQLQSSFRKTISLSNRHWRNQSNATDFENLNTEEIALFKYESALQESRTIKTQLSNLRYDPFNFGKPDQMLTSFRREMENTLARALRIQNTVTLLDGIIRNDPKHEFSEYHINLFAEIGCLIYRMLTPSPKNQDKRDAQAACTTLTNKLANIRRSIIDLSTVVASSSREMAPEAVGTLGLGILASSLDLTSMDASSDGVIDDDKPPTAVSQSHSMGALLMDQDNDHDGRSLPKLIHGSRVCALLFLQLVEHLTLRSVRLYQSWQECEVICDACEKRFA